MKQIRAIRILLATLFFVASLACLILGPQVHPMAAAAAKSQIILSSLAVTSGAALVWLLLSFAFGRVYCATACPIGTYSDLFLRLRRKIPRLNKPFRYRHPDKWNIRILVLYLVCLLIGLVGVPFLVEPWNITRNMTSLINPHTIDPTWATTGAGALTGMAAGLVSAILLAGLALWRGREFCTQYCPIGTALGLMGEHTLMHIEINPDICTACGKCEEICRASCIKTLSKYVDNSRCVRCFDCVAECPEQAIRFQINRNRPATPLMKRAKT